MFCEETEGNGIEREGSFFQIKISKEIAWSWIIAYYLIEKDEIIEQYGIICAKIIESVQ